MKWTRFFGARPHLNRTSDRLTSRQISGQPSTLCLSQISLSPGRQTDVPYRSQTGKLRTKHFSCLSLRFSTATSSHSTWLHLNHKCFGGPWSAQVGDRQSRSAPGLQCLVPEQLIWNIFTKTLSPQHLFIFPLHPIHHFPLQRWIVYGCGVLVMRLFYFWHLGMSIFMWKTIVACTCYITFPTNVIC